MQTRPIVFAAALFLVAPAGCSGPQEVVDPTVNEASEASAAGHHQHHGEHEGHGGHGGHGPIGHTFEDVDKYADRWNDPARDEWQKPDELIRLMGVQEGMTVGDIGAGTGYLEPHLAKAVGESGKVLALDAEPKMVEYLQQRAEKEGWKNVEPRKVEYGDPKVEDGSVARFVIVNTWHHIREREAYGKKVLAGLQPGGSITVVDYTMEAEGGPPKEIRLAPEQVKKELEAAGFVAEIAEETLPKQYVVIGRKAQ